MDANRRHLEIAKRAYLIWEREGRVHGYDLRHWLLAESEIRKAEQEAPMSDPYNLNSVAAERQRQKAATPMR
jgi:hypothetical protein